MLKSMSSKSKELFETAMRSREMSDILPCIALLMETINSRAGITDFMSHEEWANNKTVIGVLLNMLGSVLTHGKGMLKHARGAFCLALKCYESVNCTSRSYCKRIAITYFNLGTVVARLASVTGDSRMDDEAFEYLMTAREGFLQLDDLDKEETFMLANASQLALEISSGADWDWIGNMEDEIDGYRNDKPLYSLEQYNKDYQRRQPFPNHVKKQLEMLDEELYSLTYEERRNKWLAAFRASPEYINSELNPAPYGIEFDFYNMRLESMALYETATNFYLHSPYYMATLSHYPSYEVPPKVIEGEIEVVQGWMKRVQLFDESF